MMLVLNISIIGFVFAQDAEIPTVDTPPVIDSIVDDVWNLLDGYHADTNYFTGSENVDGPADLSMIWKGLHDNTNLYFLFNVFDDVLNEDSPQPVDHKDDCVELFFDTDDGDEDTPDPYDDFMLKLEYSSTGISPLGPDTNTFPTFDTTGVVARCAPTGEGYIIETSIPLANLGLAPEALIGFDARVNDDDDGDNRDSQLQWWNIDINDWNKPAALPIVLLTSNIVVNVDEESAPQVDNYQLAQNFPNPFNPSTEIRYTLSRSERIKLTVTNISGREIVTLVDEAQNAGEYRVTFNAGQNLSSGIYCYRLRTRTNTITKTMVLLK